jgi:electron transfer flavoprotein alpha subunit
MEGNVRERPLTIVTLQHGASSIKKLPRPSAKVTRIELKNELVSRLRTKVIDIIAPLTEDIDITKADVIIAVGRGVGKRENIALIEELAKAIRGVLACSRPVADMGWLPESRVVGTSGKKVSPKLYIALGISGALQHIVGMESSKIVVAINKDPQAPIFDYADYGIVEDMFKVLPLLIEEVKKLRWKS